jgi:MFS family permease
VAPELRPALPRQVVVLGVVSLLHDLAGDLVTPLLPAFVASIGGGPTALGIIEGVADAAGSFLRLASGYFADRFGRLKALTLAGYAIPNVLRPLLAFASAWWQVLLIRFGDRVGKGLRASPRDALLASVTPKEIRGRAYGFHGTVEYIGSALGPALGFLILSAGVPLRHLFALTAIPGLLVVLVLALGVRGEPRPVDLKKVTIGLPPSHAFRRLLIAVAVFTLGNSSDAFLLWRAAQLGIPVKMAPILWIVLHVVKSASSTWGGSLSDRKGRRFAIVVGWLVYAAVYLGFGLATAPWQIWALFAIYGSYSGLTEASQKALVVDLVDERWRARALGAYHACIGFASLPASVLFGILYKVASPSVAFGTGAGLALVAALLIPPSDHPSRPEPGVAAVPSSSA